jgi:hypothetical protein
MSHIKVINFLYKNLREHSAEGNVKARCGIIKRVVTDNRSWTDDARKMYHKRRNHARKYVGMRGNGNKAKKN